jgi:hypothetical protein
MLARCPACEQTIVFAQFGRQTCPKCRATVDIDDPRPDRPAKGPPPEVPNPYAPPSSSLELPLAPDDLAREWTVRSMFLRTWEVFIRHWPVLLLPAMVEIPAQFLTEPLADLVHAGPGTTLFLRADVVLAATALVATIDAGWTAQWLAAARGQTPTYAHFMNGLQRAWPFIVIEVGQTCTVGAVGAVGTWGTITGTHLPEWVSPLEIWAQTIVGVWTSVAMVSVIDERTHVLAALRRAWRLSAGNRAGFIRLSVTFAALVIAGLVGGGLRAEETSPAP